jgi:hypothetical protein
MKKQLVFGDSWIEAELPDNTDSVSAGLNAALPESDNLDQTVTQALADPIDMPKIKDLVGPGAHVVIAFDDPTVPCWAPVWNTAISQVVDLLADVGVTEDNIELLCANALHRKFDLEELSVILGKELVDRFARRISCHDAEDKQGCVDLGMTKTGYQVELNRKVIDSDLFIYINVSTMRAFSGGWKSICVGLSTYRSITQHHDPYTMSMSLSGNKMHAILEEMGSFVEEKVGRTKIFKFETVLASPISVSKCYWGRVSSVRKLVTDELAKVHIPRRAMLDSKFDVVLYGVPNWSPYATFSFMNPILTLVSTGLGYLGGMIEAAGKPGCTVIMANPVKDMWDEKHHPSYKYVWDNVLPFTRDPFEIKAKYEPQLATDETLINKYRFEYAFHPTHACMALYPLKRLRHAGQVIVVGAESPSIPERLGFLTAGSIESALDIAKSFHGKDLSVLHVEQPFAFNRTKP